MAPPPSSNRQPWIGQSIVVGLSCGIGFYLAREIVEKRWWRDAYKKLSTTLRSTNLWEATVPWWLVFACPSPWYPLALWFVVSTHSPQDSKKETNPKDATNKQNPRYSDPFLGAPNNQQQPEAVARSSDSAAAAATSTPPRYLEMLVHNVSHTDLVLSVDAPPSDEQLLVEDDYCLCRPRFSAFDMYCQRILASLSGEEQVIKFPRYERSETSPRYSIVTPKPERRGLLPTGLSLEERSSSLVIPQDELLNLRFRGRDAPRIEPYYQESCSTRLHLSHVFFPLLATLLPRWFFEVRRKYSHDKEIKKVIVLVSGVGTPRNWTHSLHGNSTRACAQLMEKFIQILYPDVTVVRIHSDTNIFRYDENIVFCKRELMPRIDAYRDAHARGLPYPDEIITSQILDEQGHAFATDWKRSFSVTLSFADGSHARTRAIQCSLRPYRPRYFHFWQLKTFWHDTKIVEDDLEAHSFEDMETVPAMDTALASTEVQLVVKEMKAFRSEFLESLQTDNDISLFWLRKTKKPVLAVLLVGGKDGSLVMYRGTNMEVSMPTGSLCAERNVIGSALASNPALKRENLRMLAVLAVPLVADTERPPNMPRSSSLASYASIQEGDDETDWVLPAQDAAEAMSNAEEATHQMTELTLIENTPKSTPPGTPIRRITLYPQARETHLETSVPTMGLGRPKQKRTVLVHSTEDLNPLRPCGACNEWLKKIAESNPYFTVCTFTDADCNGVYVNPCQD